MSTALLEARALLRLQRLAEHRFRAPVTRAEPLQGDASDRAYARLHHPGAEPPTSIGMIMPGPFSPEALPFLSVRAHLAAVGLPVPALHAADPEGGLLLLEDGGGRSLEDLWRAEGWKAAKPYYLKAIDLLAPLQRAPDALGRAFDAALFARELHQTRRLAFEGLLGMEAPEEAFAPAFEALARELCRLPFRLTHRDYHSRNLLAGAEGRLLLLDFQDARMGPATYDLASLVFDSYAALPEDARELLIGRFWEGAGAASGFGSREDFRRALAVTGLQRNLKAIGTFAFQRIERGTPRYLPHVPPTARSARLNLARLPERAALAAQLEPYLDALEALEESTLP